MPQVPALEAPTVNPVGPTQDYQRIGADPAAFGAGVGRGMMLLGNAIGASVDQIATSMANEAKTTQEFDRMANFTTGLGNLEKYRAEKLRGDNGAGIGWTKEMSEVFDKTMSPITNGLQGSELAEWNYKVTKAKQDWLLQAQGDYYKINDNYFRTSIDTKDKSLSAGLYQTPTPQAREYYAQTMRELISKSNLSAEEKAERIRKVEQDYDAIYGAGRADKDPDGVIGALGGRSGYEAAVSQKESGGRKDIGKHPGSSAWGEFGITEGTWTRIANSPEGKAAGLSSDPEARKDPANNRLGFQILTKLNAKVLASEGIPVNDRTLYLAHFAGPGGAVQLLRADPEKSAESVLPAAAASNPAVFYKDAGAGNRDLQRPRTVAEVVTALTAGLEGKAVPLQGSDPILARLTPQQQASVLGQAERNAAANERDALAQVKAQQSAFINDLALRLHDGKAGMEDIAAAREAGHITDFNTINHLESIFASTQQKATTEQEALAKFSNPDAAWVPRDSDDKKRVDALWEKNVQQTGDPYGIANTIAAQTHMMPGKFTDWLMSQMTSGDTAKVGKALEFARGWMNSSANAFDGSQNSTDIAKLTAIYDRQLELTGDPAKATAKVIESFAPEARNKATPEQVTAFRESFTKENQAQALSAALDTIFTSAPDVPAPLAAVVNGEMADLAAEHFKEYGDAENAKRYALQEVQKYWGTNAQGVVMKYVPEKYYPLKIGGSSQWIYDQAAQAVKEATGVETKEVFLLPLRYADSGVNTGDQVRGGQKPQYGLVYRRPDGVFDTVLTTNKMVARFRPNPEIAVAKDKLMPSNTLRDWVASTPKNPLKGLGIKLRTEP